ncbi:MAG: iron-sulfur cluster assembly protein [Alphaproteobacteria bacterium]|nr:iron-sulfur cluster assembly protein [Alphaproteobacteria bacterium]
MNNASTSLKQRIKPASFADRVVEQLKTVYDPEIPVNIYDLGLIYDINIAPEKDGQYDVKIQMTLTSPACPIAEQMPLFAQQAVQSLDDAGEVTVDLVWNPPWDKSRMTDEARMQLDMF